MDSPNLPPIDTSEANLAYINGLKPGEEVVEMGVSCMRGRRGTVYLNAEGQVCVRWRMDWNEVMGTSVTWGTRRVTDL